MNPKFVQNFRSARACSLLLILGVVASSAFAGGHKCLHVASYAEDYSWTKRIDSSMRTGAAGSCAEFRSFFLDGKKNAAGVPAKALEAKKLIEEFKPDVVLVSDDLAVKHLLFPFYKGSTIPFVFCGVNWSAKEYGLPYKNATGVIEVNALEPVWEEIKKILPQARKGVCLNEDTETGRKICERFATAFKKFGVEVEGKYVENFNQWKARFEEIQTSETDFIVMSVVHGIKDWNFAQARQTVYAKSKKLGIGLYDWVSPLTVLSINVVPEEQGKFQLR